MTFYDEPVVEQIGHLWGVWVDDGDELVACSTLSEALTLKQKLIEFRNAIEAERDALQFKLDAADLREKGLRRKIEITEEYATSRLCPDHRGKWERDRCVMCELDERQRYIEHITDESKAFKLLHSKAVDERDAALSRLGAAENRLDLIDRMRINLPEKFWHAELTAILAGERDETAGAVERQEPNPDYVPQIGPAHCRKT